MRVRTALKIIKVVGQYTEVSRLDMPYNGQQIYAAAKRVVPVKYRHYYRGWHKVTKAQGRAEVITILKGGTK